jgi:cytochrome b561
MANLSAGASHGRVASATKYLLPQLVENTLHQTEFAQALAHGCLRLLLLRVPVFAWRLCPKKNPLPGVNLVTDDANDGK